jgi:hypothetical protein
MTYPTFVPTAAVEALAAGSPGRTQHALACCQRLSRLLGTRVTGVTKALVATRVELGLREATIVLSHGCRSETARRMIS